MASRASWASWRRGWWSGTAGPTFLIAFDGDIGKGSGRSISRFDLHAALLACGDLLERFGGHHMAAGLTIRREKLDAFRERFGELARGDARAPRISGRSSGWTSRSGCTRSPRDLERLCRYLEPCGTGNSQPGLRRPGRALRAAGAGRARAISRACWTTAGRRLPAIGFQWADRVPWLGDGPVDAAFRIECNEWNGQTTLQARLCALSPHAA